MKKILFVLALMLLLPITVLAEEKAYEYVDFKLEKVEGETIKDTKIQIYASVEGDEKNFTDRTDEFKIDEMIWSVCVEEDCATSEEVSEEDVFENGKEYVLMIRITAKNGANFNVWGTDRALLNGTPIEELDGEYANSGSELMIKSKTVTEKEIEKEDVVDSQEKVETIGAETTCLLGLSLCCTMFLGLSICIWILIAIALIIFIIIFLITNSRNRKEDQALEQW